MTQDMARKNSGVPSVQLQSNGFSKHQGLVTPRPDLRRRQTSSCDQCRQGKRACDASRTVFSIEKNRTDTPRQISTLENLSSDGTVCCSYCSKTGKSCTFSWLTSVLRRRKQTKVHAATAPKRQHRPLAPASESGRSDAISQSQSDEMTCSTGGSEDTEDYLADLNNTKTLTNGNHRVHSESLSPDLNNQIYRAYDRSSIADNLLRVYRDSMENALECWLTEENCPYTSKRTSPTREIGAQQAKPVLISHHRILERVCKLDKELARSSLCRLSHKDYQAALRVLRLAMMSFASQWAQSGTRESSSFRVAFEVDCDPAILQSAANDRSFGRTMQESLWYQTRDALREAEGMMSSQVAFAFIIFSLTQQPIDLSTRDNLKGLDTQQLMGLDNSRVFLESAVKQLSKMRRVLQREAISESRRALSSWSPNTTLLDQASQDTFDLLFWLSIMFDTLSAAMHDISIVVADEDCETARSVAEDCFDLDGLDIMNESYGPAKTAALWSDRSVSTPTNQVPEWPCESLVAEQVLREAAPVKVLFFRKISCVQLVLNRKSPEKEIERALEECLLVYSYWQRKFQPFIKSCIASHESLPPQIQSWYVVLAGHWHLAGMLFADVLETTDASGLSCPTKRLARQRSAFTDSWRLEHATAISDLAEAALRATNSSFSHSPAFHAALNKSALLSEPWTAILTRSCSKAASHFLGLIVTAQKSEQRYIFVLRAQRCIEALLLIGKKSDIALLVAEVLRQQLRDLHYGDMPSEYPIPSEICHQDATTNGILMVQRPRYFDVFSPQAIYLEVSP